MSRRLLLGAALALFCLALLWIAPALARPERPPGRPPVTTGRPPFAGKPTTTTLAATTTSTSTTTTTLPEPTTTTVAPTTTTETGVFLDGTAPVTDQGVIIYGLDFVGLPIPGGDPPEVRACPAGTVLDFEASTFEHPANLSVQYLPDFGVVIVLADLDTTGTVSYHLACV